MMLTKGQIFWRLAMLLIFISLLFFISAFVLNYNSTPQALNEPRAYKGVFI